MIISIACIGYLFDLVDAKDLFLEDDTPSFDMEIPLFIGPSDIGYNVQPLVDNANNVHYNILTMSTRNVQIIQLEEMYIDFYLENNKVVTFTAIGQARQTGIPLYFMRCFDKDLKYLFKSPIKQTVLRNSEDVIIHQIFNYKTHDPDYFTKLKPKRRDVKPVKLPKLSKTVPKVSF